jgi:RNA polymerase sigma factor (sigma-70 family)
VEASTIPATASLAPSRGLIAAGPLLRLRSDEQLVRLFRAGHEEAFRVIHDRYRTRLLAYARQMLGGSRADAEDALQDVFVRAYGALRANDRDVSLRAWLYRIAHNRCVDELRRPAGAAGCSPPEALELLHAPAADPMDAVERRESLRRLVEDVRRLPEHQRSALLMREISGMAYQDLAAALDVTVPAVKSLLVRARIGLAQAAEARDTACAAIRADLADAHERGVRASGLVRRHLHDCTSCSAYRRELRALDARLAALVPALGPAALLAKLLGVGGGGAAAGGGTGGATATAGAAAAGGGAGVAGGATATAAVATAGVGTAGIGVSHIAAAVAVAVVSTGGAVEVHQTLAPHQQRAVVHAAPARRAPRAANGAAAVTIARETDAARRGAAAKRLQLRIAPATVDAPPVVIGPAPALLAPTLDPSATAGGNGGAVAPLEPPGDTVQPIAPDGGVAEGPVVGATSGSSSPSPPAAVPTPGDATAPLGPPSDVSPATPPSTSVAPAASPTASTPPTSATTGGATYSSSRRRR